MLKKSYPVNSTKHPWNGMKKYGFSFKCEWSQYNKKETMHRFLSNYNTAVITLTVYCHCYILTVNNSFNISFISVFLFLFSHQFSLSHYSLSVKKLITNKQCLKNVCFKLIFYKIIQ